jgi:hypothetical protein
MDQSKPGNSKAGASKLISSEQPAIERSKLEQLIVQAASAPSTYVPLTALDIYLGHYIIGGVYFFLGRPDLERMKSSLAAALDRHPSFGACMVREADNIGLYCGSAGAALSIHHSDADCPDLSSTESLVTDALFAIGQRPDDSSSDYDGPDYPMTSYSFNSGLPVARIRLVLFKNNRYALVVQHVHSQADGSAATQFLQNWSRAYRGEVLPQSSGYTRMRIAGLATLPGLAPSDQLSILPGTASEFQATGPARDGSAIRTDLSCAAVEHFVNECRRACRLSLSSSEVLHALVWKCFALSQTSADVPWVRLYTLFDLRSIKPLGIPQDYDGSAVLGRCAKMEHAALRASTIPLLALAFQRQIKPFTADDAHTDISYLARQYRDGHIDKDGNYVNFVIGAWLHCRDSGGLIVNDLRRLGSADIPFEEGPARMETMVNTDINIVSIYQNDDGTITVHYVGERRTLAGFAERLKAIVAAPVNGSIPLDIDDSGATN